MSQGDAPVKIGEGNRTWHDGMSDSEAKELAYYERNMLALRYADGWYYDKENNWITFHIPDGFNVGNLRQIEPNWDGHTTEEKWARIERLMSTQKLGG